MRILTLSQRPAAAVHSASFVALLTLLLNLGSGFQLSLASGVGDEPYLLGYTLQRRHFHFYIIS